MKRPWETAAAGWVLGEVLVHLLFPDGSLTAGGALTVLMACALFSLRLCVRSMRPASGESRSPASRENGKRVCAGSLRIRHAVRLFLLFFLLGALRLLAAESPSGETRSLDRLCGETETGAEVVRTIEVSSVSRTESGYSVTAGALVVFFPDEEHRDRPRVGTRIRVKGKLERIPRASNPGEFDAASYYAASGVTHRIFVREYEVTDTKVSPAREMLSGLRERLVVMLSEIAEPEEAGFLSAALFGDRSLLDPDLYALYRENGIAHLLAISGLHISILGLTLCRGLRRAGLGIAPSALVSGAFLIAYGALTGNSVSVTRAVLMLLLFFLSAFLGRNYDLLSAACFSAVCLLAFSPLQLFQCGFQLSFAAVLSIGGPGQALIRRLPGGGVFPGAVTFPGTASSPGTVSSPGTGTSPGTVPSPGTKLSSGAAGGLGRELSEAFVMSVSVSLCTLPAVSWWFFSVPLGGIFLNLAVIPLMGFCVWSGIALLLFYALSLCCGGPLSVIFRFSAYAAEGVVHRILQLYTALCVSCGRLGFLRYRTGRPEPWQLVLYAALLISAYAVLIRSCGEGGKTGDGEKNGKKKEARPARERIRGPARKGIPSSVRRVILPGAYDEEEAAERERENAPCRLVLRAVSALLLAAALISVRRIPDRELNVWFLDVGQGDSIAVMKGGQCVLIDGGSSSDRKAGERILKPFLESMAVDQLDAVFITHADSDHTNAFMYLLSECPSIPVRRLYLSRPAAGDERYDDLRGAARRAGTPVSYIGAGERVGAFQCIAPFGDRPLEDVNEESLVLFLEENGVSFLFTGDAGEETERQITDKYRRMEQQGEGRDGRPNRRCGENADVNAGGPAPFTFPAGGVTVLKAGHHGSQNSTTEDFLSLVRPVYAVLSYGKGNRYGHPHDETIKRLEEAGVFSCRTAEDGAVRARVSGGEALLSAYLKR